MNQPKRLALIFGAVCGLLYAVLRQIAVFCEGSSNLFYGVVMGLGNGIIFSAYGAAVSLKTYESDGRVRRRVLIGAVAGAALFAWIMVRSGTTQPLLLMRESLLGVLLGGGIGLLPASTQRGLKIGALAGALLGFVVGIMLLVTEAFAGTSWLTPLLFTLVGALVGALLSWWPFILFDLLDNSMTRLGRIRRWLVKSRERDAAEGTNES